MPEWYREGPSPSTFGPGTRVRWCNPNHHRHAAVDGTVYSFGRYAVTIDCDDGKRRSVAPKFLTKLDREATR